MSVDWQSLARAAGIQVDGEWLVVVIGARKQRVRVRVDADDRGLTLDSRVAAPSVVDRMPDPHDRIWAQNRLSELVGFRLDGRNRLTGKSWVPAAGLMPEEFAFYVRNLAVACDRLELVLTGDDAY